MHKKKRQRARKGIASTISAALIAAAAVVGFSPPAQAAGDVDYGIGMGGEGSSQPYQLRGGGPLKSPQNWHGSYFVPGVGFMFCLNAGLNEGFSNDPGGEVNSFQKDYRTNIGSINEVYGQQFDQHINLGPSETFKINYAIQNYGQLGANWGSYSQDQAYWGSAVEMYIWSITNPNLVPNGSPWDFYKSRFAPDQQAEVGNRINIITAAANAASPTSGGGSGNVSISMDNYHEGSATISMSPSDAVATLSITGGTFPGGMTSISGVTNGQTIPITGNAVVNQGNPEKTYNIQITGSATGTGSGITDKIRVASNGGKQDMVMPGANVSPQFDLSAGVADPLIEFSPVVKTQAPKIVTKGSSFLDTVVASAADPTNSPWATYDDGTYLPIRASGTLYGPLTSPPTESAAVPSGTPVAGTANVVLRGPGSYNVKSDFVSGTTGYYTWVWSIDGSKQGAVARMILPQGYTFTDNYGQAVETSKTPMKPVATSKVERSVVDVGDRVRDTLHISNSDGQWIDGATARFYGTAYAVTTGKEPEQRGTVPADNVRAITSVEVIADKEGDYVSPEITVPADAGYVVWVWRTEDKSQDDPTMYHPNWRWADQFGIPDETQRVRFSPEVKTAVASKFVQPGSTFTDTVSAFAASGRWTGKTSVKAEGTLYGPFAAQPEESSTAPEGAPVAGTTTLDLNGPGAYFTDGSITATEAGYYTWVWNIDAAKQSTVTQGYLPSGYSFTDRFAQTVETSITPMQVTAKSKVVKSEVALDEGVQDTLDIAPSAQSARWLMVDGENVPVTFHGTAYFIPGEDAPAQSDVAPAGTEVVGETSITANSPGLYESETLHGEDYRAGHVTWVWSVRPEDQPEQYRKYILGWSDGFGIPDETTKVSIPKIATKAQSDVPVGDTFHDTAEVSGLIPANGTSVHFELYRATKDASGGWVCAAGNLLWTSESQRIDAAGEYVSPEAPFQSVGDYHWVEVLTSNGGHEISRGVCGLPDETTTVIAPKVTTKAQPTSALGNPSGIHDVASVEGAVAKAGYDLTFEAYRVPVTGSGSTWTTDAPAGTADGDLSWVCNSEPVFSITKPVKVNAAGDYVSESFVPKETGKYLWVETLRYLPTEEQGGGNPVLIHRGECGVHEETSFVTDITTQAQEKGRGGAEITDTAIVSGFVPEGATISFSAYKVASDAPEAKRADDGTWTDAAVCSEGTFLGTTEKVALPSGYHDQTKVTSAGVLAPDTPGVNYKVYWIETAYNSDGSVISTGHCGLPNETTTVESSEAELAWTGGSVQLATILGVVVLGSLIAMGLVYTARRRRQQA